MAETLLLLSARAKATEPTLVDQEVAELSLNLDGRLRTAGKPALFTNAVGVLTTAGSTAANVVAVDVTDCSNVTFHLKNIGSAAMAAGVFVFEASLNSTDGVDGDWLAIQAVRSDSNTVEASRAASSLAAGAVQAYGWEASVNGYRWFRIRCSTTVTASAQAQWTIGRGAYATEPIPAVQAHGISGTVSVAASPAVGTPYKALGLAATTGVIMKSSSGSLMELSLFNPTAATIFVKLYDKSTAPAVATDSALLMDVFEVPTLVSRRAEYGLLGKRFGSGISYACTAGAGNTDATAPATAGLVIGGTYV